MVRSTTVAVLAVLALAAVTPALAYPAFWAADAPSCLVLPGKADACHKAPVADKSIAITVLDGTKPVMRACAGKAYTIRLSFPNARLAYLATTGGPVAIKNNDNKRCPNTFAFGATSKYSPSTSFSMVATAPRAGSSWTMNVASATGACSAFLVNSATIPVGAC